MSKKTPGLEEVRAVYANEFDSYHGYQWNDALAAEFDRFIAKVRADALREAAEALPKPVGLNCSKECHNADWLSLLRRADRIEADES